MRYLILFLALFLFSQASFAQTHIELTTDRIWVTDHIRLKNDTIRKVYTDTTFTEDIAHSVPSTELMQAFVGGATVTPIWVNVGDTATFYGGRVGIGTSLPSESLEVVGKVKLDNVDIFSTHPTSNVFGLNAGENLTDGGTNNTLLGNLSGGSLIGEDHVTCVGTFAGENSIKSRNTLIGSSAARFDTLGADNVIIGYRAGLRNVGSDNNFIGVDAGENNTGSRNNFIGMRAGENNTGNENTIVGDLSGLNVIGSNNVVFGGDAGGNSVGDDNNFFGQSAGQYNTGKRNVSIGRFSGRYVSGNDNISLGGNLDLTFTDTLNLTSLNTDVINNKLINVSHGKANGAEFLVQFQGDEPAGIGNNGIVSVEVLNSTTLQILSKTMSSTGGNYDIKIAKTFSDSWQIGYDISNTRSNQGILHADEIITDADMGVGFTLTDDMPTNTLHVKGTARVETLPEYVNSTKIAVYGGANADELGYKTIEAGTFIKSKSETITVASTVIPTGSYIFTEFSSDGTLTLDLTTFQNEYVFSVINKNSNTTTVTLVGAVWANGVDPTITQYQSAKFYVLNGVAYLQ